MYGRFLSFLALVFLFSLVKSPPLSDWPSAFSLVSIEFSVPQALQIVVDLRSSSSPFHYVAFLSYYPFLTDSGNSSITFLSYEPAQTYLLPIFWPFLQFLPIENNIPSPSPWNSLPQAFARFDRSPWRSESIVSSSVPEGFLLRRAFRLSFNSFLSFKRFRALVSFRKALRWLQKS